MKFIIIDLNQNFYFSCCNFNYINTYFFILETLGQQWVSPLFFVRDCHITPLLAMTHRIGESPQFPTGRRI